MLLQVNEKTSRSFYPVVTLLVATGFVIIPLFLSTGTTLTADELRVVERFEGVEPSWAVRSNRSGFNVYKHRRSTSEKKSGKQSEFLHFKTGNHSDTQLVHAIRHARVIRDFCPHVWIKANHDRINLNARVVLPNTPSPIGDGPLRVLVPIDQSESSQAWEKLGCVPGELMKKLNARLRNIQFQFKNLKLDVQDAFCDLIVLSGFDKLHSEYQISIDDISVQGFLPARSISGDDSTESQNQKQFHRIELSGSLFSVNDKPVFVRAIIYNGEPFSFLKKIGFNTVLMSRLPTLKELEQAQQYQLWIICPPILDENDLTRPLIASRNLEMILAWNMGSKLTSNELDQTKQGVSRLRAWKPVIDRPTFCHAHFPVEKYEHVVDFQRFMQPVYGTSLTPDKFREFLLKQKPLGKPFLVNIQTRLPRIIGQQASLLLGSRQFDLLSAKQIENLVFQSLFAGARGLVFQSNTNLQQSSQLADWLVPVFKVLNRHLIQIDPWIAGGSVSVSKANDSLSITFDLPRSQLTLANSAEDQFKYRGTSELELETNQKSPRVYRITDTGIAPLEHQSKIGKLRIELDPEKSFQRFLISEDSLSLEYVHQSTNRFDVDGGILKDQFSILENSFRQLQTIIEDVSSNEINSPATFVSLGDIKSSLKNAKTFLDKKQMTTVQAMLNQIEQNLEKIRFSVQQELLASRRLVSSPFNADFSQLSNYVFLERKLQDKKWSANQLPGASFDSLGVLARSGWVQHWNDTSEVQVHVSLAGIKSKVLQGPAGRKAMQIETWKATDSSRSVEVTPVWITSPKIKVAQHQLVRVDGYIRIEQAMQNSRDGFMMIDNIGGPELASRFFKTGDWRYFAIERIVPQDMEFGVVLAQTGLGSVQLSNLKFRVCDLGENISRMKSQIIQR